ASVARWVEMARISTLCSRLGQGQKQQQRDPLQFFNSLLADNAERGISAFPTLEGLDVSQQGVV
ncbi:MAG: hypothetical protein ACREIF_08975, partial [Chthoniobacterales bacterium]